MVRPTLVYILTLMLSLSYKVERNENSMNILHISFKAFFECLVQRLFFVKYPSSKFSMNNAYCFSTTEPSIQASNRLVSFV